MAAVAGKGSFDHKKKQWKVRTKNLKAAMTIAQLSAHFGIELPNDERKTRTYWLQYLDQIQGLDVMRAHMEAAGQVANHLAAVDQQLKPLGITLANVNSEGVGNLLKTSIESGLEGTLQFEIDAFVNSSGYKKQYKTNLAKFMAVVGNIPVKLIEVNAYRKWLDWIVANHEGVAATSVNKVKNVKAFLTHVETLYNLNFAFLRNKKLHKLNLPNSVKRDLTEEYWTVEEIQKCLACDDFPKAKFALLMGLNCGCYICDLDKAYFSTDKVKGNLYTSGRAKLVWQGVQKGRTHTYKLWDETLGAMVLATSYQFELDFKKMKKALGITKQQSGLRKTAAQHIHEMYCETGEALSRLYRNEGENDTHYTSYVTNASETIVSRLAEATDLIHKNLIVRT